MEKKDVPDPLPDSQNSSVPDTGKRPEPTFYLKVRLHCCASCFRRAKERLQKMQGVVAINVDTRQELLAVSGTVDPQKIIEKFAKWGKKAVLWTPQKDAAQFSNHNTNIGQESNAQRSKKADGYCCAEDDSDSEPANDLQSSTVTWQHPDVMNKLAATANTEGGKKHCWLLRLFGKLKISGKSQGAGANPGGLGAESNSRPNIMGPSFNSFPPRRPMLATYGAPMPFYPPCREMPSYGSIYRAPMMYERPAMPPYPRPAMLPYPYHQPMHMLPPPPPPYGFSRPISPPLLNPMIHHTRYEDNYT